MSASKEQTEVALSPENYPASALAYDIALKSYETALQRLEFVETRLQTTLTLAATLTLAVPAVASARGLSLRSDWLVAALIAFVIAVGLGTYARWTGEVVLLNPNLLFDNWMRFTDWEFKTNMVRFAGKHFEANSKLVQKKWRLAIITTVIFFLEIVFLFLWLV